MNVQATPRSRAAELAVAIYGDVLARIRGDRLVNEAMARDGDRLVVQSRAFDLAPFSRVLVVAVGKAAVPMARAALEILGDRVSGGLIVTKHGHGEEVPGLETIEAGHPVPDESSLFAGRRILDLADSCGDGDFVVFLLSGGASALMEVPAGDLSLEDLRRTNELLLASGADIVAVNRLRAKISRIKGGGLARAFAPATVVVLALSDVVGNSLAAIGSGPFTPLDHGVRGFVLPADELPASVRAELLYSDLLSRSTPHIPHFVIGSVSLAIHEAMDAAVRRGLQPTGFQDPMRGEAREMARKIVALGAARRKAGQEEFCLVFGGETTVRHSDEGGGKGGRSQEMAVAASPLLARLPGCAFLAAGTDGTDGPTDAAGGLVEPDSRSLARSAGFSPAETLARHDSYPFLAASGGLLITGPTGSNVNDLSLFVHA